VALSRVQLTSKATQPAPVNTLSTHKRWDPRHGEGQASIAGKLPFNDILGICGTVRKQRVGV
jgi:hypothetical protein